MKYPTLSCAIDALIGDEGQNGKRKKKNKEAERVPNPDTLDHSVASYDVQGSYDEPILFTSCPTGFETKTVNKYLLPRRKNEQKFIRNFISERRYPFIC